MPRDSRLDLLRVLAIIECILSHTLMADHTELVDYLWTMMFVPDTAGVFFMASGAIILRRETRPSWPYVWHRLCTFLPEFIIFSALYATLDHFAGLHYGDPYSTLTMQLCYMFVTPTWAPGWFILALMGLYVVMPMLWSWVQTASRREIEIGIILWLVATTVPIIEPHTPINLPMSAFGTLFNYAGYMLIGYYLVQWPFARRSRQFHWGFFAVTIAIGVVFGYFLGRSGARWGYMKNVISGMSLNIVMMSVLQVGVVLLMPKRWFDGRMGRIITWFSLLSLGIYCSHWLVVRYWAIPNHINWMVATVVTLAFSIPMAWVFRRCRLFLSRNKQ